MSKLGSGTYGNVQKDQSNSNIAIKTIHFANIHSAIREIVIIRDLSHPNIINLEGIKLDFKNFQINIYMECFEKDLEAFRTHPKIEKFFVPKFLDTCVKQLFKAMYYLHQNGVIHRDITPGNILIKRDNGKLRLSLCDFGLAVKKITLTQNNFETNVCTVTYRAPEIYLGVDNLRYTEKVDIWSFGCVLYFLISGKEFLDYDVFMEIFPNKRQESSLYLAYLFEIPLYSNHLTRLKSLKDLKKEACRIKYQKMLDTDEVKPNIIGQYIDLLSHSLTIDHKKRPNTIELFDKYSNFLEITELELVKTSTNTSKEKLKYIGTEINKNSILEATSLPKTNKFVNGNWSNELKSITQLAHQSDVYKLSLFLYQQLIQENPDRNTELIFVGILFIASLFLETDNLQFEEEVMKICPPVEFSYVIMDILDKLDWSLPSRQDLSLIQVTA